MINVSIPKKAFLPAYQHLLTSTADINFLWGGRDSGKSHFIAQRLIVKCLSAPYFRCILLKKSFNTIQESQWQTIKDICEAWGIDHLFQFRVAPLSIICINGNRFIARGLDDPQSIKSIKDPSDAWHEEGNMETMDDFVTVTTTLRTNKAKIQQWFSFNPECAGDFKEFWLYKTFFEGKAENGTHKWEITLPDGRIAEYEYTSTHTTYRDNPKVPLQRIAFMEQLKYIDPYKYQVYCLGKWGNQNTEDPYCYAFNQDKHIGEVKLNKSHEVILSFDFNVNPITCGVYQHSGNKIRCVESIKKDNSDIYKLLEYINTHYKGCMFLVTGDATGRNTNALVQDGINYYTVIKSKLGLSNGQLRVPTINPKVSENRVLVNVAFHSADIKADPVMCKDLIFDWKNVSVTDAGEIDKGDRNNPKKRADHLDHFRYYLNTFHKSLLKS